jgi:hypothetical protein
MHVSQTRGIVKLTHFTPQSRAHWCWMFFAPVLVLLPGEQRTIFGTVVTDHPGSTVWEGVSGLPKFQTREEALAWCEQTGFCPDSVEVEF